MEVIQAIYKMYTSMVFAIAFFRESVVIKRDYEYVRKLDNLTDSFAVGLIVLRTQIETMNKSQIEKYMLDPEVKEKLEDFRQHFIKKTNFNPENN